MKVFWFVMLFLIGNAHISGAFPKGGGGKGGGKGGGGGSSGTKGGSSSSSSNRGGTSGSSSPVGVRPAYGSGGRYYGGGATVPYTSGSTSPHGLTPATFLLVVAVIAIFEGPWLYPAYVYSNPTPYTFYNASAGQNQTKPVDCLCEQYQECGCDENTDPTYMNSLFGWQVGNGSALNSTLVQVNKVNGTWTIVINGTLPNGTVAASNSASGAKCFGDKVMGTFALPLIIGVCFITIL